MIPVHAPVIGQAELENVRQALLEGEISGSFGRFIPELEQSFAAFCGCEYGVAVSSGTAALHIACALANIKPGDEVLVSTCTNIACAVAVVLQGGTVVPVDVEPDTWNMNPDLLKRLVTKRTKAIMPVHAYGHPVEMDPVLMFAKAHGLFVIEDCAEAHGARYFDRPVGSLGDVGCFSFYANKPMTTGEGGMLVTNDSALAERAQLLRNLAFGQPRFVHKEIGFNYRMTNLQAAVGVGQFSRLGETLHAKRRIAQMYSTQLGGVAGLRLPVERNYAWNIYWMYCIVVEDDFGVSRDTLAAELKDYGVETRTMFCPLNMQPALLQRNAVKPIRCMVAEDLWQRGLYLPSGCQLTSHDVDAICQVIEEVATPCA